MSGEHLTAITPSDDEPGQPESPLNFCYLDFTESNANAPQITRAQRDSTLRLAQSAKAKLDKKPVRGVGYICLLLICLQTPDQSRDNNFTKRVLAVSLALRCE